jgi:hypothetical protein
MLADSMDFFKRRALNLGLSFLQELLLKDDAHFFFDLLSSKCRFKLISLDIASLLTNLELWTCLLSSLRPDNRVVVVNLS